MERRSPASAAKTRSHPRALRITKIVFPAQPAWPTLARVAAQGLRKTHVLLVDDDASMRRALARTIRLAGFDVESFASAESLLASGRPDRDACLVLDIDLPGMDGIACKRTLDAAGHRLPTVFITALTPAEVCGPLAGVASVAILHKPFNKDDLLDAIGRACP